MNHKVLLIYPVKRTVYTGGMGKSSGDISVALLYLASAARSVGAEVRLFDMNVLKNDNNELVRVIKDFQPSVVGINCLFSMIFPVVREIGKLIKQENPGIHISTGGIHPTIFAEDIISNCPEIDSIVVGEGEQAFQKLLKCLWSAETPISENSDVLDSIVLRFGGRIFHFEKKCYNDKLDDLPMPAYDLLELDNYRINMSAWFNPQNIDYGSIAMSIISSRSCPNACNFCAMRLVMGRKLRVRSAESVFNEIKYLYDNYGVRYFRIMDDNFTFYRQRAVDICSLIIDNGLKIAFEFPNGLMIRTLDDALIGLMAQAGMVRCAIAIEHGNDYIRNNIMRKNVSKEKIAGVLDSCRKYNVLSHIMLLIGLPEETHETLQENIDWLGTLHFDSYSLSVLIPFPQTAVWEQSERDNLFVDIIRYEDRWKGEYSNSQEQKVHIKPYKMTANELLQGRDRLFAFLDKKTSAWKEHVERSTKPL